MNVAQQGDEIARVFDRLTAVSVVKQGAETLMPLVIVADIGNANAFHHCADVLSTLSNKQMDMIIHQTIGVDVTEGRQRFAIAVFGSRDRTEYLEKLAAVLVIGEDVAAVNTTKHHVVNAGIAVLSAGTWHDRGRLVLQR